MTHLDFVSTKETLPRLASTLNPLCKGFSLIIRQECVRPLAFARGDKKREAQDDNKKERLRMISHILSCRAVARHPSLRSGRRPLSLRSGRRPIHVIPRRVSAEGPLAYARGDKKERLGVTKREKLGGQKVRVG